MLRILSSADDQCTEKRRSTPRGFTLPPCHRLSLAVLSIEVASGAMGGSEMSALHGVSDVVSYRLGPCADIQVQSHPALLDEHCRTAGHARGGV